VPLGGLRIAEACDDLRLRTGVTVRQNTLHRR
jgi:hypothetical protein